MGFFMAVNKRQTLFGLQLFTVCGVLSGDGEHVPLFAQLKPREMHIDRFLAVLLLFLYTLTHDCGNV